MYHPANYGAAILLMLISMACWGSWPITMKFSPGWRFQLYYWDFIVGVILASLLLGLTLGSYQGGPSSFVSNLQRADGRHVFWAVISGFVLDVANLLLVAAIECAGMSVAFPVAAGLALVEGVVLAYVLAPKGNPILLFGGVCLVMIAIVFDACAYRSREARHQKISTRTVGISLAAGIILGLFYPLATKACSGMNALDPFTVVFVSSLAALLCNIPVNHYLTGQLLIGGSPMGARGYFEGRSSVHGLGLLGGLIWCSGTVLSLVAGGTHIVGPAVSYAVGQGCTVVSAIWGVFVWREFAGSPAKARTQLGLMFLFFVLGLGAIALAPVVSATSP